MNPRRQLQAAHAALAGGAAGQALDLLAPLLAAQPDQVDALQLKAGALLQLGQAAAAALALQRARLVRPDDPVLACNLGVAEQAAGRHDAAVLAFRAALALRPDSPEALVGLAGAARLAGDPGTSIAAGRRLLALRPGDPAVRQGLALALADAGEDEPALREAQAAVQARPDLAEAWRTLAAVHERAGRIDPALAVLQRGASAGADGHALAMAAGHLAHRAGRLLAAAAAFAQATNLQPQSAQAWNNLAACQTLLNRIDEAIAAARRAVALAPTSPGLQLTLAAALSRSREPAQIAQALAVCRALLAAEPGHAGAHDCAALVLAKQGDPAGALPHARAAVAAEPDNPAFVVTLARVLEQGGDLAGAEAVLVGRDQDGAPAPLQRQLGHVRLRLGRPAPALLALDRAWRLDPLDQGGIAERALALAQVEGWPAAEAWLDQADLVRPVEIATPPGFADRGAFLGALAADIRSHSQLRYEPAGLVARGGYLTGDLLADATPAITGFAASLRAAIAAFIASLPDRPGHPFLGQVPRGEHLLHVWATRVGEQGVIDTHYHEGSWLSGAFYVELPPALGSADAAGWLEFGQPFPGLPGPPPERLLRVRPEPGLMLFFPSYLFHRTLPYRGEGERISISFDLGPR